MKLKRPGTAVIFAVILAAFVAVITPRALLIRSLNERSARLEAEIRKIKAENARLEAELMALRDDPVYLEKVAREKFNKAKQGEIVYKVVRPGEPADASGG